MTTEQASGRIRNQEHDREYRRGRIEIRREYVRGWEAANQDRVKRYRRDSINRSLERYLLNRARSRAKAGGIAFAIALEDISVPEVCPILGIPLARGRDGRAASSSPTLDRIVPELGYVTGNVQVISHKANSLKRDGTLEELVRLGEWAATRSDHA